MTDDHSPPDALRALIAHELETPGPSDADRERIHARVAATLGFAAGAAATGAVSGTAKAAGASAKAAGTSAKLGLLGGKLVVLGVVVSAATGIVIATRSEPARPKVSSPAPREVVPATPANGEAPPSVPTAPAIAPSPASVRAEPALSPSPPPDPKPGRTRRAPDVPDQATLLARAWTALSAGKAAETLELVELDLQKHQAGPLDEERDALRIRALVELGRLDEARTLVAAFVERYPTSIQLSLLARLTKIDDRRQ